MKLSKVLIYVCITVLVAFVCKMIYVNVWSPNMEGMHNNGSHTKGINGSHHSRPAYTHRSNVIYTGGGGGGYSNPYYYPIYDPYYYDRRLDYPVYLYPNSVVQRENQNQYTLMLFMMFFFAIVAIMIIV